MNNPSDRFLVDGVPKSLVVLKGLLDGLARHMISIVEHVYPEASDDSVLKAIRTFVAMDKGVSPESKLLDNDPALIDIVTKLGLPMTQLSPSAEHTGIMIGAVDDLATTAYNVHAGRLGYKYTTSQSRHRIAQQYNGQLATAVHAVESDPDLTEQGMKVIATIHELAHKMQLSTLDNDIYEPGKPLPMGGQMSIEIPQILQVIHSQVSPEVSRAKIEQHRYYDNLAGMRMMIADVGRVHRDLLQR